MLPENISHLTIRSATNDDCERVAKLVFGVLAEFGLEADPKTTDADLQDIEQITLNEGPVEVIEDRRANLLEASDSIPLTQQPAS